MFLNVLTPPQQRVFVDAARAMLHADGTVAETELALLDAIRAECDLDYMGGDAQPATDIIDAARTVLDTTTARNAFLLELAGVAVIDGDTHASEMALLERFAAVLGQSDEHLREVVAFAERANTQGSSGDRERAEVDCRKARRVSIGFVSQAEAQCVFDISKAHF